ncbi:hypothetical protein [Knoellia subterranea]|uniref:Uncharacterized protein n=1 Tax=Knoellia subterranea KCTC 19937 TaxID=1385521 RepID=A0A0A0JKH8_9MICO|nr:hypothetical protein [Knoellia subterranea]KGN37588.1 hypothetical protein N803_14025 [Knoellia subterranea KCTC 19937]
MPNGNDFTDATRKVGPIEWRRSPHIVVPPLERPVDRPIDIPIDAPVDRPVDRPIDIPIDIPIERPIDIDVDSPFLLPRPVTALRTSDLLLLRFSFANLSWARPDGGDGDAPGWVLRRRKANKPAYLIVDFPPQHLVEEAFPQKAASPTMVRPPELPGGATQPAPANTTAAPTPPPVRAILSQHSRLSFVVKDETIEWSLDGLLSAMSTLPLSVVPHATNRVRIDVDIPFELVKKSRTVRVTGRLTARGGLAVPGAVRSIGRSAAMTRRLDERLGRGVSAAIGSISRVAGEFGVKPVAVGPVGGVTKDLNPGISALARPAPRPPEATETAIELPWRLQLSPHAGGAFTHSHTPIEHDQRVELWHSRLGQRATTPDGAPTVDENDASTRTVRAIWARDMEGGPLAPAEASATGSTDVPNWTKSLTTRDRRMLVDETSNFTLRRGRARWTPPPAKVDRLMLTALGGWLRSDLDVPELPNDLPATATRPAKSFSITEWKHRATMGRDHEVKVVYAGFLFPFGHRASLVKLTERQFDSAPPGSGMTGKIAYLRQRFFIVVRDQTLRFPATGATWQNPNRPGSGPTRLDLAMPLASLSVLTRSTPDLDPPKDPTAPLTNANFCFIPTIDDVPFAFHVLATDREDNIVEYAGPLLFVERGLNVSAASLKNVRDFYAGLSLGERRHPLGGQRVAFAASKAPDGLALDTTLATDGLEFDAAIQLDGRTQDDPRFVPVLGQADVVVPAMNALAGAATPAPMQLPQRYLEKEWTGNVTHVFLEATSAAAAAKLTFTGKGDRSGGFVTPNLDVTGLSGSKGPIGGDIIKAMDGVMQGADFFAGLDAAKLFGAVKISDLVGQISPDNMPSFIADSINEVTALLGDVQRILTLAQQVDQRLAAGVSAASSAADAAAKAAVAQLKAAVATLRTRLTSLETRAKATLTAFADISDLASAQAALTALAADLTALSAAISEVVDAAGTVGLKGEAATAAAVPTALLKDAAEVVRRLSEVLADAGRITEILDLAEQFLGGSGLPETVHARMNWSTPLDPWPKDFPLFQPAGAQGRLDLSVDVRAPITAGGDPSATIVCSMTPFSLRLLGKNPFIELKVETLEFTLLPGKKPDVNLVLAKPGMVFGGPLSFVNALQDLVPFDGFSDPPYLDVSTQGIRAGFDLALPDISIGVFSLANLSIGAEAHVPFIGDSLDFRFNFCTRENPFRLTVWVFGGGGFFAISVTPDRCRMLEAAFEFGAAVALDFGVASGSIECMAGIYFRLETNPDGKDDGKLAGYFRLRGEVDVLGLISASLELYLELSYEPSSGKAVGRASLTIEVEVCFLSTSVQISCEKKFKGSNADPTFEQVMGTQVHGVRPWDEYCNAFATA